MYLYVVKSQNLYKIGIAYCVESRIKTLQTGCPSEITLVHRSYTPGGLERERYWHREFAAKRERGEWFRLDSSDVKRILAEERKELAHYRAGRKTVTQAESVRVAQHALLRANRRTKKAKGGQ
jgi:hypothetical protein